MPRSSHAHPRPARVDLLDRARGRRIPSRRRESTLGALRASNLCPRSSTLARRRPRRVARDRMVGATVVDLSPPRAHGAARLAGGTSSRSVDGGARAAHAPGRHPGGARHGLGPALPGGRARLSGSGPRAQLRAASPLLHVGSADRPEVVVEGLHRLGVTRVRLQHRERVLHTRRGVGTHQRGEVEEVEVGGGHAVEHR